MAGTAVLSVTTSVFLWAGTARTPESSVLSLCTHFCAHLTRHTGTPEPALLQTDLVLVCPRNALGRYACSQQLWCLRQPILEGLGAAAGGQDEAKSKQN